MWLYLGLGIWPGGCSSWTIENGLRGETEPPPDPVASDPLSLPGAASVPIRGCATCDPKHPAWDVRTEWRAEHPGGLGHAGTPIVAHLDDDDGDGGIGNRGDRPEILVPTSDADGMRIEAVHGDGTPFRIYDGTFHGDLQEIAVADLDADGLPEIVAVTEVADRGAVVALSVDGRTVWQSEDVFSGDSDPFGTACLPVVTDLEGDGRTEVLCDAIVLDGATGATLWRRPLEGIRWGTTTVGDLDLDGRSEVVFADRVYRSDGTPWWGLEPGAGGVFPAVAELDGDPEGELLFAYQGSLAAYDTDGTPLWHQQVEKSGESRPCLADFDGDGEIEIASAFGRTLAMFERDGTLVWKRPIDDPSTAAGCAAFDFDRDGDAEIAYADHSSFGLYCGADGSLLYQAESWSGTITEFPIVADVDADGSAEVIVSFWPIDIGQPTEGIVVYGNPEWPGTGAVFPQPDYRTGTQRSDGAVTGETTSWLDDGLVRARVAAGPIVPPPPPIDLAVVIADRTGGCDGLSVAVQIENRGPGDVAAGQILEVRAVDTILLGTVVSRLVEAIPLPAVPSGTRTAALRVDLDARQIGPRGITLAVPIGNDVSGLECDPTNQDVLVLVPCE